MLVSTAQVKLYAPWVHSLKEKRMIVKSIVAKVHNKFNVSIAEIAENDIHQTIVLGIAGIAGDRAQADSILDHTLNYIEGSTDAEIVSIEREVR